MNERTRPCAAFAAGGAFISVALVAFAAAGAVAGGAAGHSHLRLADASIEAMSGLQDICAARPACANAPLQQPAASGMC